MFTNTRTRLDRDCDDLSHLTSFDSTPYPIGARSSLASISGKYSFSVNPRDWGSALSVDLVESDDDLHTTLKEPKWSKKQRVCNTVSSRGLLNTGSLLVLLGGLMALFIGYPIITFYNRMHMSNLGGYNLGGTNGSGQVPELPGNWQLVDLDTPQDVYTISSWNNPAIEMQLVFSDEFNIDGRTFYPGDDPYWEAVDLHYWATNNLEWYDPEAITTEGGSLVITLSQKETHGLNYQGGMVSTWNKFCFTGGYIETSVSLPGANNIVGLWPAIWTMGNLGRAGYGATLEGVWPYTYDSCDVGTVANQTIGGQPIAATINGDASYGGALSYLPGQRLSRCTCSGESHPGPNHTDGTFVGRSAPEIDIFEAQEETLIPEVSQSAQWAPFDAGYSWNTSGNNLIINKPDISKMNSYTGGIYQQATSVVTNTDPDCYETSAGCFSVYGFEYKPGFDDAYITWISNNVTTWTFNAPGMGSNPAVELSARPVSQEPMYLIANLGLSRNFGPVDIEHLPFPVHMRVDYIRVYQPKNAINIGCDPKEFPTKNYIDKYIAAYSNPNITTWVDDFQQPWPKNSLLDQC